jgi:uncharacterized damage-inducible protein DinB
MRLVERMIEELNRMWNGDAWYGPSVRPMLEGITEEQARANPVADGHSILELVVHSALWMHITTRRLEGYVAEATTEQDWRDVRKTSWSDALADLERAYAALLDRVARLNDDAMNSIVPNKEYTVYTLLTGVIEHTVYHAGQIAMLKKAV